MTSEDARITIRLAAGLMQKARDEATLRGLTLNALIEQGRVMLLHQPVSRTSCGEVTIPSCSVGGGLLPGVDLSDSVNLQARMDSRD